MAIRNRAEIKDKGFKQATILLVWERKLKGRESSAYNKTASKKLLFEDVMKVREEEGEDKVKRKLEWQQKEVNSYQSHIDSFVDFLYI